MSSGFFNSIVETEIHLLPSRLADLKEGIRSILNCLLMRYNPQLEGVVLAYDNIKLLDNTADVVDDRPHLHFRIRFRVLVYQPKIGEYVTGVVNNIGESDHIGLLVHGLFNATLSVGKGLPNEFEYIPEEQKWKNSETNEEIELGTSIRFKIIRLDQSNNLVSLQGSMLDEELTGIRQ